MYGSIYDQVMQEFHCSEEVATLGLSFFVLGLAIGPMLFGPLSEVSIHSPPVSYRLLIQLFKFYGRRPIYIVSIALYLVWLIPCAAAQNIQTLIVGRFLGGLFGSAFQAVSAGSVVDVFSRNEIQFPMVVFTTTPFMGPVMGPVIGGFICQFTSW